MPLKHCVGCGKRMYARSNKRYCSTVCRQRRPPSMIRAERLHGEPMETLLMRWLERGVPQRTIAELCGVSHARIGQWMQALGIEREVRYVIRRQA